MKILLLLLTIFAIGCSSRSPSADPGDTPPGAMAVSEKRAEAVATGSGGSVPNTVPSGEAVTSGEVVTSCSRDADCAVKNVGNCCGYFPACVHKDSQTFPERVKAQCEKEGTMGICGFREITACMCVEGRCAAADSAL